MITQELLKVENFSFELYGPNPSKDISNYCENVKQFYFNNIDKIQDLIIALTKTENQHFKFWLLDIMITIIKNNYKLFPLEIKNSFRQSLLGLIYNYVNVLIEPYYVANKFSLLFISFIKNDYPEIYSNIWIDIITDLFNTQDQNLKIKKFSILLDILLTFDDELIKYSDTYNEKDSERATKIKDFMREETHMNDLINIINVIQQLLSNEEFIEQKIINKGIKVISQLIDWCPIVLFEQTLQIILNKLLFKKKYICESIKVLISIIHKGMKPNLKIEIIKNLKINEIIENIFKTKQELQVIELTSDLINNIGQFLVESYENIKDMIKNKEENYEEYFNFTNDELLFCFKLTKEILLKLNFEYKPALELIDYLSAIISYFKSNEIIIINNENLKIIFKELFVSIENSLIIPKTDYSLNEDLTKNEDDDFFQYRKEFSIIYHNIYNIKSMQEFVLDSVLDKINSIQTKNPTQYDIELVLFLVGTIQQGIRQSDLKNELINQKFQKILSILFIFPFTEVQGSDYIITSYYETINKLIQYLSSNIQAINYVIKLYLGKTGIMFPGNIETGIKIVNSFDKFLYKIKNSFNNKNFGIPLNDVSITIRQTIEHIIQAAVNNKNFSIISNYKLLFHCLSIVIFLDNNNDTKKDNYQNSLKLFINMTNVFQMNEDIFGEIIKCLIEFIKNINCEITVPEIKNLFIQFFTSFFSDYCLKIISQKNSKILYSFITLLQRILVILGKDSIPFINYFYNNNNNLLSEDTFSDSMKLMQNIINILQKNSKLIMKENFYMIYIFLSKLNLPSDDISDFNKGILSIYSDFIKLTNTIFLTIPEIFFEAGVNNINLISLVNDLLTIGKNVISNQMRRSVMKTIKSLTIYLNKNYNLYQNNPNINELLTHILNGSFEIYNKLNLKDPLDSSTLVEICQCHFYISIFKNFYSSYLLNFLTKEQAENLYSLIIKVNPKNLKVPKEIIDGFNYIFNKGKK